MCLNESFQVNHLTMCLVLNATLRPQTCPCFCYCCVYLQLLFDKISLLHRQIMYNAETPWFPVIQKVSGYHLGFFTRASKELVGPISSLQALIASCLDKASAHKGPLVMNSTRPGKKGLPLCSA
jgi:hypothetical protein